MNLWVYPDLSHPLINYLTSERNLYNENPQGLNCRTHTS